MPVSLPFSIRVAKFLTPELAPAASFAAASVFLNFLGPWYQESLRAI